MEKSLSAHHKSDVRDGGSNKKKRMWIPSCMLEACGDADQKGRREKFCTKVKTTLGSSKIYFAQS